MADIDLRNKTKLEFTDISTETYRTYHFVKDGETFSVCINKPQYLNVSRGGGHRILDEHGLSHYVPKGWHHLLWKAKDGEAHFVK